MGTWGLGPFDNDTASDWAGDLDGAAPGDRPALIRETLTAAADAADYLDGDDGMTAIAAAAVVAAVQPGGPALDDNYGPDADTLATLELDPDVRSLATRALLRVLDDESEWRELWEEAGQFDDARSSLDPILAALDGA
jgi:hypothetical protein